MPLTLIKLLGIRKSFRSYFIILISTLIIVGRENQRRRFSFRMCKILNRKSLVTKNFCTSVVITFSYTSNSLLFLSIFEISKLRTNQVSSNPKMDCKFFNTFDVFLFDNLSINSKGLSRLRRNNCRLLISFRNSNLILLALFTSRRKIFNKGFSI